MQTASQKSGQGQWGWGCNRQGISRGTTYGKRLLDALSWLSETWKISIAVKDETTVDVYVDMYNFHR